MEQSYRANGKLLLSGEYFVLDGAKALTLPLQKGQTLSVSEYSNEDVEFIQWQAFENNKRWFNAHFNRKLEIVTSSDSQIARNLARILKAVRAMNASVFDVQNCYQFKTNLEFNKYWGLGSSSTLTHLLAEWAHIDALKLHFEISNGSGYDVVAATHTSPFIYSVHEKQISIRQVHLQPEIESALYFAYLGKKQLSEIEVLDYRSKNKPQEYIINRISSLTDEMVSCSDLPGFEKIIDEHEQIVAEFLNRKRIKQEMFSDYWGNVKSLGAWGGDFVMLTHAGDFEELKLYLEQKGINTCFAYDDIVFDTNS